MKPLILVAFLLYPIPAHSADLPPGIDCNLIRSYVAEHGKAKALGWAIKQGYSWGQISAARRCLK
jgi:hypothetical protein